MAAASCSRGAALCTCTLAAGAVDLHCGGGVHLLNGLRDGPFAVAACHALDLESLRLYGKTPVDGWRVGITLHPIMNLHIMSWSSL